MQHYSCKCGERTSWGSMGPPDCKGCEKCGTRLEWIRPDGSPAIAHFRLPVPHEWRDKFDENTGKPIRVCAWCGKREPVAEVPT